MITDPPNYFGASSSSAGLKLEIMNAIWDVIGHDIKEKLKNADFPLDREKYYDVNRKLSDALDKYIHIISARHEVDQRYEKKIPKEEIHYIIARQIADLLLKSDFVAVREFGSDYTPNKFFEVQVPFLKAVRK